jgi:hypothetical protein
VHRIAFEEHFDPVAVLGDGENDAGSAFEYRQEFFAAALIIRHD